jgi:hypothetical protein
MEAIRVSSLVSSPNNEGPELINDSRQTFMAHNFSDFFIESVVKVESLEKLQDEPQDRTECSRTVRAIGLGNAPAREDELSPYSTPASWVHVAEFRLDPPEHR